MGYAIRAGAVHSNDCWKNIFPHDSPIYLRHRWLKVPITDSVCWVFLNPPPPYTHTHTHSHYSKYKKSRPVSVKLCVWNNTTSWKNIYYRHAHTAVQWPHFKTINRSKWIGSVYPSAKHVLTPSNEMSAGLMMPAYYLTVNTNDPLHSVSVRPPPRKFHDHTHTLSHTDWWIDSNTPSRICCLAFAGLLHIIQRHAHEHNYTACLEMAWKTTGETYQQFCLNSLHADKRTECESVLLLLLGRGAGLGLNSVPVVESSLLLKLSKYGSVSDPNAAELTT